MEKNLTLSVWIWDEYKKTNFCFVLFLRVLLCILGFVDIRLLCNCAQQDVGLLYFKASIKFTVSAYNVIRHIFNDRWDFCWLFIVNQKCGSIHIRCDVHTRIKFMATYSFTVVPIRYSFIFGAVARSEREKYFVCLWFSSLLKWKTSFESITITTPSHKWIGLIKYAHPYQSIPFEMNKMRW